jgi:hypothetical protein
MGTERPWQSKLDRAMEPVQELSQAVAAKHLCFTVKFGET